MKNWTDEELEDFIRNNKDAIVNGCRPVMNHEQKFLSKLKYNTKKFVSLNRSLLIVATITLLIYIISIFAYIDIKKNDKSMILKTIKYWGLSQRSSKP